MNLQKYWDFNLNAANSAEAKKIHQELQEIIQKFNKAYYHDDDPLIEDLLYDKLFSLCLEIEKNSHP